MIYSWTRPIHWPNVNSAMPFPLAHPAAVLPLRRFCPRWLDFPALVIGSVVPDAGYLISPGHLAPFTHRLIAGTFVFCLPVGFLLWLAFDWLRNPIIARLPLSYRVTFPPRRPPGPWQPFRGAFSLLLGTLTHWLLDSSTHWNGCFVRHSAALQRPLVRIGHGYLPAFDALYYLCTFLGTLFLTAAYLNWLSRASQSPLLRSTGVSLGSAILAGAATTVVAWNCRTGPALHSALILVFILLGYAAITAICLRQSSRPPESNGEASPLEP